MTPNTIIRDQQAETLRKFLNHRYEVYSLRSSDNTPARGIIAAKDVLVSTPQLIVNLLSDDGDDDTSDMARTTFELTIFTMMVFDECHSAVKNSPYAVLMRFYHRLRFLQRGLKSERKLPQVIGLTASLGVGGASNVVDATKHVIRLCACLDCDVISTVRKYSNQLRKFSPTVVDEVFFCDDSKDENRRCFIENLCELMNLFEAKLYTIYEECFSLPVESHSWESAIDVEQDHQYIVYTSFKKAPEEKLTQGYLNWVSNHLRRIVPEMQFNNESAKTQAMEILEILYDMYRATEMYQDFSTVESYTYLKERINSKKSSLTRFSSKLWQERSPELSKYQSSDSALISELVKHLCVERDDDFRAIVFVRTRKGAFILSRLLNIHPDFVDCCLRVESIAGSNRGECQTTTKREQVEKMKRFKSGETRVLVATSVADEGLDVADCNLVIKYNCASNEIAHVQRRGRGRAKNSRSILLTQSVKLKEQEEKNVESLMKQVLCSIQEHRIDFSEQVRKAVEHLWSGIQREDVLNEQRLARQKSSGIVYKLLCSKCDTLLCTSKDVKTRNSQYCVCDPSFWSKTRNEEIADDEGQRYNAVAKLYCIGRNCGNSLGRIVTMDEAFMPVLGASAFVLEFPEGGSMVARKSFRRWKEVVRDCFSPEKIRNYDLAAMNKAFNKPEISSVSRLYS